MFIAGGVSAALLHREKTGEALEMDVSLLTQPGGGGAQVAQVMETGVSRATAMPTSGAHCAIR